ncbi:MAG: lipopolysaccharide kinase InaA family protein [Methylophagaceae bacterium]
MTDYLGEGWQTLLSKNNLATYGSLWQLKADWFEEPNIRRGGWSGVVKVSLKQTNDDPVFIFIKRQENHLSRTWRHPIKGAATFIREYNNLRLFHKYDIPTPELVYFGARSNNGKPQAIIATKELVGYQPLNVLLHKSGSSMIIGSKHRQALFKETAKVLYHMHQHRLQHNSLHPKHIFAKPLGDNWDIRIIDLETAKRRVFKQTASLRDLATLRRQMTELTDKEQMTFFKAYVNEEKLSIKSKKLWSQIKNRILKKSK